MEHRAHVVLNTSRTPRRAAVALAVVGLTLALVAPAQAVERTAKHATKVVTPTATALTIAQAIASSSVTVSGASFVTKPPDGQPNGVGDSSPALTGFPVDGGSYGILTTGDIASVEKPGTLADTSDGGANVKGNSDYDVSILKIDLAIPQGVNCLSFNFRFLSEEYPTYVGSPYNDAFIAELDKNTWTTADKDITAPDNFAFDADGKVVSINSTGTGGMTPAAGAGTAFDGTTTGPNANKDGAATELLGAATPVTAGAHSLYLSIFDQSDHALDSAVFLDNLRSGAVADPKLCKPGATKPAFLTLVKTVDNSAATTKPATDGTHPATDWTLSATGPTTISGSTGTPAVTHAAVSPGTYTLGESGPPYYTPGEWSCNKEGFQGNSVPLAAGDNVTCTINNKYVPPDPVSLTLTKTVDNTAGGTAAATDWTLKATGPSTISGATGSAGVTSASVFPGTYTLTETGPTHYSAGAWSCQGGTLTGNKLVVEPDSSATCSITNTYVVAPTPSPTPTPKPSKTPHHTPAVTLPPTSTVGDSSSTDGGSGLWLAGILAIASVIGFALAPRPRRRKG